MGNEFDAEAFDKYIDELCETLTGEGVGNVDGVFPDGRFYDWDPDLRATIETAPDGRRHIVELRDGQLVRVRELTNVAA